MLVGPLRQYVGRHGSPDIKKSTEAASSDDEPVSPGNPSHNRRPQVCPGGLAWLLRRSVTFAVVVTESLGQNAVHDCAGNVGKSKVAAGIVVSETLVIEP